MLVATYYRRKRGLSQQALADMVGTLQPTICRIERGEVVPDEALLQRIAAALGVSPAFNLLRPVVVREQAFVEGSDEPVVVR